MQTSLIAPYIVIFKFRNVLTICALAWYALPNKLEETECELCVT